MANTMKFGNGQWATKKDSILAYNDENANFKPLPFVTSRASTATRVNKAGLIETVASGIPRVDYLGNTKGAYLLEPQSTNLFPYSEDFSNSNWTKENATITVNQSISPDGTLNADRLTSNTSGGLVRDSANSSIGIAQSFSFFIKNDNSLSSNLSIRTSSTAVYGTINWEGSILSSIDSETGVTEYKDYGNGWYRIFTNYVAIESEQRVKIYSSRNGDDKSVYIWGAQFESNSSYSTSYIKTQGSAITRLSEYASQTVPSGIINSSEGVFFIDVTNLGRSQNTNILTKNSIVNSVYGYFQTNDKITFGLFANSVSIPIQSSSQYPVGTRTKIALHYKSGNTKLYVNGSLEGTSSDAFTLGSDFADDLRLLDASSAYFAFPGKSILNEFKAYNTVLTDAELVKLTTI